jgi:PIN domain nuclease of toxin-antitoxin system
VRLLLDTHALLWTMSGSPRLSGIARSAATNPNNEVFVSVASVWEAAIKYRSGKLPEAEPLANDPQRILTGMRYQPIPVGLDHAKLAASLVNPHKDPFDRMLAAQALLEGLTLVSNDQVFDSMLVTRLW